MMVLFTSFTVPARRLANGQALEFIIAVPGRRYNEFQEHLDAFHRSQCQKATEPVIGEQTWRELRLVVAHDPVAAEVQTARRSERIEALLKQADEWTNKLDGQDMGERQRGRPLSDSGAKARLYHAVAEAHLSRIIKINLKSDVLRYQADNKARKLAEMMDGKLLLVSNAAELSAEEVVERYKSLADIERGFKVLKSEIEIGPVYHRLPERIRAHAQICFMALILHRVMRSRLKSANTGLSPERAIERLERIQHHRIHIAQGDPMTGVSTIASEQAEVFSALKVKKPTASKQLSLL